MATKTFSGRAEESKLVYADALTEQLYGISYGQYCSSILLDNIKLHRQLPSLSEEDNLQSQKQNALKRLREMSERLKGSKLATMTDEELKRQIASRYA